MVQPVNQKTTRRIEQLLAVNGQSQAAIARAAGVSVSTVARIARRLRDARPQPVPVERPVRCRECYEMTTEAVYLTPSYPICGECSETLHRLHQAAAAQMRDADEKCPAPAELRRRIEAVPQVRWMTPQEVDE